MPALPRGDQSPANIKICLDSPDFSQENPPLLSVLARQGTDWFTAHFWTSVPFLRVFGQESLASAKVSFKNRFKLPSSFNQTDPKRHFMSISSNVGKRVEPLGWGGGGGRPFASGKHQPPTWTSPKWTTTSIRLKATLI